MIKKIKCERLNNLDIAYVNNRFTSFKHDRNTIKLDLEFGCYEDDERGMGSTIMPLGNLIWVAETEASEHFGIFCFVVSGMFVTKQMREESLTSDR